MNVSLHPATKHQIERMVDDPCSELAGQFDRRQIEEVMNDSVERVVETAKVFDFVPLMAYRVTRERLQALRRAQGQDADGAWDVVFVSLSGGGRGLIDIPQEIRHDDWRVGDPIGAPIAEIRRVRADIEYRVRAVLTDLGVPIPTARHQSANGAPQDRDISMS